jgi:hypothetical protein
MRFSGVLKRGLKDRKAAQDWGLKSSASNQRNFREKAEVSIARAIGKQSFHNLADEHTGEVDIHKRQIIEIFEDFQGNYHYSDPYPIQITVTSYPYNMERVTGERKIIQYATSKQCLLFSPVSAVLLNHLFLVLQATRFIQAVDLTFALIPFISPSFPTVLPSFLR